MTEPAETVAPAPDGKRMAILTYIDATENMVQEFGWLYRSWIYSGNWRTSDLIVCCHPAAVGALPDEPGGYAAGERYFPDEMTDRRYYVPVTRGLEIKIGEALAARRARDAKTPETGKP